MQKNYEKLLPEYDDGRFFVSPVLGCIGGCAYCYLPVKNYTVPKKNDISVSEIKNIAESIKEFVFGREGTIISVGAWGDIFPAHSEEITTHSVELILELLTWENPIQIMSKNAPSEELIDKIAAAVRYEGQLLYSTTITTIKRWKEIEPNTASPEERLNVCQMFKKRGISTNVEIKPFIGGVTDAEIEIISKQLVEHNIDYCVVGVLYYNENVLQNLSRITRLAEAEGQKNHLDCNGNIPLESTSIMALRKHILYLRSKGINAFAKSSCVNANILKCKNPSGYYDKENEYCIMCGNCSE